MMREGAVTARTSAQGWWQSVKEVFNAVIRREDQQARPQRVTVSEAEAYTLPRGVRMMRVMRGGAWVSHRREDMIVYREQSLHLASDHDGVVVTALGHEPVEIELRH
jgi:hypothetical protein